MGGYYSGLATDTTLRYFKLEIIILPVFVVLFIVVYYLIKFVYSKISSLLKNKI
jgi:uncharacterized membrane protein YhdT